jgi:hypothetical protein
VYGRDQEAARYYTRIVLGHVLTSCRSRRTRCYIEASVRGVDTAEDIGFPIFS